MVQLTILEPLKLNEGKALKHSVALQYNAVYESSGGTIKVNSNWSVINIHIMHVTCTYITYARIHTPTHTCAHTHIHTHAHTHTHTHTHTYVCTHKYMCMHIKTPTIAILLAIVSYY